MPFGMLQGLASGFSAMKANKSLNNLWKQDPTYTANPLANQQFAMAKNLFGSRMFGAPQEERNIYGANANFNANVQKNSSSGSQALALAAAGQGESDQAFSNLQQKESQNKYGLLSNLNNAYANMIGEGDKVYNYQVRRFGDMAQIKGVQAQNRAGILTGAFNGLNSDFNDATQIFGMAKGGGFSGGFGQGFGMNGGNKMQQSNNYGNNFFPGWTPQNRFNTNP